MRNLTIFFQVSGDQHTGKTGEKEIMALKPALSEGIKCFHCLPEDGGYSLLPSPGLQSRRTG
jgi:hypothetical protein